MMKSSTVRKVIICTGAIDVEAKCGMHRKAEKFVLMEDDTQMMEDDTQMVKVKVKESRNRPGVAQTVPGGLGSQIS